jgi:hypothetical protein
MNLCWSTYTSGPNGISLKKTAAKLKGNVTDFKTPTLQFANESICTVLLTMLMHSTKKYLACQPVANYHSLQVSSLNQKMFITSMIKPNNNIMEEMCGFLYEVTSTKTEHTLPI